MPSVDKVLIAPQLSFSISISYSLFSIGQYLKQGLNASIRMTRPIAQRGMHVLMLYSHLVALY